MKSEKAILNKIAKEIKKHKTFFIAGHLKPDGDTVGTSLALASLLKRLGKKPFIYSRDIIPENLKFIIAPNKIPIEKKVNGKFDCAIILECADFDRMGNIIAPEQAKSVINIDHHAHFNHFGNLNYINPLASSSAQQLYNLFKYMKMPFTKYEAECLYVGLVTDTGKFQQANTTSEALQMASELVKAGVVPTYIYDKIYASKTPSSIALLGLALNTLKVDCQGKLAYVEVTKNMFKKAGSNATETEEIINYTMMMNGVVAGAIFREEKPGVTKVSFRSRNSFDVNKIAQVFGGGGHKKAAGCTIEGNLSKAKEHVLGLLHEELKSH